MINDDLLQLFKYKYNCWFIYIYNNCWFITKYGFIIDMHIFDLYMYVCICLSVCIWFTIRMYLQMYRTGEISRRDNLEKGRDVPARIKTLKENVSFVVFDFIRYDYIYKYIYIYCMKRKSFICWMWFYHAWLQMYIFICFKDWLVYFICKGQNECIDVFIYSHTWYCCVSILKWFILYIFHRTDWVVWNGDDKCEYIHLCIDFDIWYIWIHKYYRMYLFRWKYW